MYLTKKRQVDWPITSFGTQSHYRPLVSGSCFSIKLGSCPLFSSLSTKSSTKGHNATTFKQRSMKTALKESEHILAQLRIEPTVTYLKDQKQAK